MAAEQEQRETTHPMMVGEAFVHQYYHILIHSPELVHRFYQDCSKLGRPDGACNMNTISTMKAINEEILASDPSKYKSEIQKIDAQESYKGGVLILVTGHLVYENIKRSFVQTFFLAPQDKGYFVLNDIFRYTETTDHQKQLNHESSAAPALSPTVDTQESYNGGVLMLMTGNLMGQDNTKRSFTQTLFLAPKEKGYFVLNDMFKGTDATDVEQLVKHDSASVHEHDFLQPQVMDSPEQKMPSSGVEAEAIVIPADVKEVVVVNETPVSKMVDKTLNGSVTVVNSVPASSSGEASKKSYASIVKVLKENAVPSSAFVASPVRPAIITPPESQPSVPPTATPKASPPEITEMRELEDVSSIYIKNLPLNATSAQLEEEFRRFGAIKPDGVQVRSNKQLGFCFGFVEFELASSVQQAIEASPVGIGGRQAYVEEKRPSGARVNGRGRYVPGKGGFRGDGARGRGGYYSNSRGNGRGGEVGGWNGGSGRSGGYHLPRTDGGAASSPGVQARASNGLPVNSSSKGITTGVSASV